MHKNIPEVRFESLDKIYSTVALSEVVDKVKSYALSRDVETIEFTGYKYIHYGDIHTKKAALIEDSNVLPNIKTGDYISLQKEDLVLADASEDYQGIATPALILNTPEQKVIAGLHTIALRPKNKYSSLYIYYLLHTQSFKKFGYKTGTGMKVFGINYPNLIKFENLYPTFEEQRKIGAFFKKLDDIIALQKQLVKQQQQYKKAMLQKMFPQKGERVPKVRFDGFSGDWEETLFEDLYKVSSGFAFKRDDYVKEGVHIVNGESIQHGEVFSNDWNYLPVDFLNKYEGFILKTDDIVLGLNRPITNNLLKIAKVPANLNNSLLYQRAGKVNFKTDNMSKEFSYQIIENEIYKFVKKEAVGSDQPFISTTKLEKWSFLYPVNFNEQKKIGTFFKQLDDTIALHQKKLEDYQQLKQALLQRMFV